MTEKIKVKSTPYTIILNILSALVLLADYGLLVILWNQIPENIPTHYNFQGQIDNYGDKTSLLIFVGIATALFILLTVLEHFPRIWNTGVTVTNENRETVYKILKNMLVTLKFVIMLTFTAINFFSVFSVSLPAWFTPAFFILTFGTIIFFVILLYVKSRKKKPSTRRY